jgi:hypothetical protein
VAIQIVALGSCDADLTQSTTLNQDMAASMNLATKSVSTVEVTCWEETPGTQSIVFDVQLLSRAFSPSGVLSAYLNDRLPSSFEQLTSIEQLTFTRSPTCGNGVCEIGERCKGPRCDASNTCAQDCPIPVFSCPISPSLQQCGHGACHLPTGRCVCAEGYAGPTCEYCGTNYTYIGQDGIMHCDHITTSHEAAIGTSGADVRFNAVYQYSVLYGEPLNIEAPVPSLDAAATLSSFVASPGQQNCSWVTILQVSPNMVPVIAGTPLIGHVGSTCKINILVTTSALHTAEAVVLIIIARPLAAPVGPTPEPTKGATPTATVDAITPTMDAAVLTESKISDVQPDALLPYVTSGAAVGAATISGVVVYFLTRRRKSHPVPEPVTPKETAQAEEYIIKKVPAGLRPSEDQRLSRAERGSRASRNAQLADDELQILPAPSAHRFSTAPTSVAGSNKADDLADFGGPSLSSHGSSRTNIMQLVRGVGLRSPQVDVRNAGPPGSIAVNSPLLFVSNPMNSALSAGNSLLSSKHKVAAPKR